MDDILNEYGKEITKLIRQKRYAVIPLLLEDLQDYVSDLRILGRAFLITQWAQLEHYTAAYELSYSLRRRYELGDDYIFKVD